MFLNLTVLLLTSLAYVLVKGILFKKIISEYGQLEFKITHSNKKENTKNISICLLFILISVLSVVFFSIYKEKELIPTWLLAIVCGIASGRFLSIIVSDLYITTGFYEKGVILKTSVLEYGWIKKYEFENKGKLIEATLTIDNGKSFKEKILILENEKEKFVETLKKHSVISLK